MADAYTHHSSVPLQQSLCYYVLCCAHRLVLTTLDGKGLNVQPKMNKYTTLHTQPCYAFVHT